MKWNSLRWLGLALCLALMVVALRLRAQSDLQAQMQQNFLRNRQAGANASRANWIAAGASETKAAQSAISGQLDAFRRDDYKRAATWQSSGLKQNFPDIQTFRDVIRRNYPQFAQSKSVRYGRAIMSRDKKIISIETLVVGRDGKTVGAIYDMIRENGNLRVAGVSPLVPDAPRPPQPTTPPDVVAA